MALDCDQFSIFRHVFLIRTNNSGGPWQVEWSVRMDDIIGVPNIEENKLIFIVKQVCDDSTKLLD